MTQTITRRSLVAATAGLLATPAIVRAADSFKLRCSLDTAPSHMRGQSMEAYLKALEAGSGGRIKTEIFHAGASTSVGWGRGEGECGRSYYELNTLR